MIPKRGLMSLSTLVIILLIGLPQILPPCQGQSTAEPDPKDVENYDKQPLQAQVLNCRREATICGFDVLCNSPSDVCELIGMRLVGYPSPESAGIQWIIELLFGKFITCCNPLEQWPALEEKGQSHDDGDDDEKAKGQTTQRRHSGRGRRRHRSRRRKQTKPIQIDLSTPASPITHVDESGSSLSPPRKASIYQIETNFEQQNLTPDITLGDQALENIQSPPGLEEVEEIVGGDDEPPRPNTQDQLTQEDELLNHGNENGPVSLTESVVEQCKPVPPSGGKWTHGEPGYPTLYDEGVKNLNPSEKQSWNLTTQNTQNLLITFAHNKKETLFEDSNSNFYYDLYDPPEFMGRHHALRAVFNHLRDFMKPCGNSLMKWCAFYIKELLEIGSLKQADVNKIEDFFNNVMLPKLWEEKTWLELYDAHVRAKLTPILFDGLFEEALVPSFDMLDTYKRKWFRDPKIEDGAARFSQPIRYAEVKTGIIGAVTAAMPFVNRDMKKIHPDETSLVRVSFEMFKSYFKPLGSDLLIPGEPGEVYWLFHDYEEQVREYIYSLYTLPEKAYHRLDTLTIAVANLTHRLVRDLVIKLRTRPIPKKVSAMKAVSDTFKGIMGGRKSQKSKPETPNSSTEDKDKT